MRGFLGVLGFLVSAPVLAQETAAPDREIQIHGFVSPGFFVTTHGIRYLADDSDKGSFEFSEVGINFTKPLTNDLRVGVQLFARDLGRTGDYSAKLDWFYLDWRARDWFGIRAGRVKIPLGLYNDTSDIDAARTSILLPQSVYPASNRDFLLAQTGGEAYGYWRFAGGALDYRVYGGTIFLDVQQTPGSPIVVQKLTVPILAGGRLVWETPLDGLRVGGSAQYIELDSTIGITVPPPGTSADVVIGAVLWVASAELLRGDLRLAAEYSQWDVETRSSNPAAFPESDITSERGYVLASYQVASWLSPGAYVSVYYPNVRERGGREDHTTDIAATLRFDVNQNWLVKLEGHFIDGTAVYTSSLNGRPASDLPKQSGLFLLKTTAYF